MIRIIVLSLLLPSVAFADNQDRARECRAACAKIADEAARVECVRRCPPLGLMFTGLEADALDDKPKKPAPTPSPKPAPPPRPSETDPRDREDATKPHPVDPEQHSVADSKCAAESRACLNCSLACAARKGCSPQECVAVCAKVDECMARPRR